MYNRVHSIFFLRKVYRLCWLEVQIVVKSESNLTIENVLSYMVTQFKVRPDSG